MRRTCEVDEAVGRVADSTYRGAGVLLLAVVIHRQEVRPVNVVSTEGAPQHSTIARLK
jgi:hypothetical protein